ncbi:PREDICTED: 21 kDa protein-like [Nicotiana attenuata]|uniref:21 kDa protein n=1 Tax=Nicotiana attenuata TaxID=49451 RepID=A0A314KVW4_NICAT|nr:PREDICTED: 21 kDa protein-like [Nicotiana attenuata]OIT33641.1 21 kda protein [Nicotiana attenuata]
MTWKFMLVLAWVTILICSTTASSKGGESYVRDACSVTRYQDLCMHSLASFSRTAKNNPSKWARAGVSVTISQAKGVTQSLSKLKKHNSLKGRGRVALLDCVECFQDALDNLHNSLGVLRKLSIQTFNDQMGDVTTWLSAALTDEDTCLDGFEDQRRRKQVKLLLNRVTNVSYLTSNALALVNKLATTGPECLENS